MSNVILVTGGAGYIGSHTVIKLIEAGFEVVIFDNFCNSKQQVVERIKEITGVRPELVVGDVRSGSMLKEVFGSYSVRAVIHFAGLKAVGDSVADPLSYYDNNVVGSLILFEEMQRAGIKTLIFSSSATVYGDPHVLPITEAESLKPTNPYGQTKRIVEDVLIDLYKADAEWRVGVLRYFNPVGAHPSGRIGEDPSGKPNNLMPIVGQVAVGVRQEVQIFGNDYPTPDGTGVRDYIHVEDLADGHVCALNDLQKRGGFFTANLGTGHGYSVLEVIRAFENASRKTVPFTFKSRRAGDIAECFADPAYAKTRLGWEAKFGLEKMCEDAWNWQSNNPNGM